MKYPFSIACRTPTCRRTWECGADITDIETALAVVVPGGWVHVRTWKINHDKSRASVIRQQDYIRESLTRALDQEV